MNASAASCGVSRIQNTVSRSRGSGLRRLKRFKRFKGHTSPTVNEVEEETTGGAVGTLKGEPFLS
jgi:hypothetical protein